MTMAKPEEPYRYVVVESYGETGSGLPGDVHIRPVPVEGFPQGMRVECSKQLSRDYPVGTKFRIKAEAYRQGGGRGVPLLLLRLEVRGSILSRRRWGFGTSRCSRLSHWGI